MGNCIQEVREILNIIIAEREGVAHYTAKDVDVLISKINHKGDPTSDVHERFITQIIEEHGREQLDALELLCIGYLTYAEQPDGIEKPEGDIMTDDTIYRNKTIEENINCKYQVLMQEQDGRAYDTLEEAKRGIDRYLDNIVAGRIDWNYNLKDAEMGTPYLLLVERITEPNEYVLGFAPLDDEDKRFIAMGLGGQGHDWHFCMWNNYTDEFTSKHIEAENNDPDFKVLAFAKIR